MTDLVNEKYFISLLRETLGLLLQDTLGHMWCAEALALYISVFILLLLSAVTSSKITTSQEAVEAAAKFAITLSPSCWLDGAVCHRS